MKYFAGLDWGGTTHAVCVVNEAGQVVLRAEVRHDADGLESLQRQLKRIAHATEIPIAIERPSGLLIDALLADGHPVIPIHPNAVKACRPRYSAAGSKNDLGDAYMLADVLRTDGHRFQPLVPPSDDIKALRALVRTRDDLVNHRLALANQLRALLDSFWPGAAGLFYQVDSPIALAFLQRYPTPGSAARLGGRRLAVFLSGERYSGRHSVAVLLARLRAAPLAQIGKLKEQAKGELVLALATVLSTLLTETANLTARIEQQVAQLDDGILIMSLPRTGRLNAAKILSEVGDIRGRLSTADQLAAEAGVAPTSQPKPSDAWLYFKTVNEHAMQKLCHVERRRHPAKFSPAESRESNEHKYDNKEARVYSKAGG